MSERFIRCPHCGLPHSIVESTCPITRRPIARGRPAPPPRPPRPSDRPHSRSGGLSALLGSKNALLGSTLGGKYKVRAVLGQGGMGTVYEAEHVAIGRLVAVKVLHPAQARKQEAVSRFHQEARAAGSIGHPNICEVYDLGALDDGSPYLVMERLTGETLADRIATHGGIAFDEVLDVLIQVLSGLIAAHEKGILHRDIKPENVFLSKRVGCPPIAKLLDFGVSKFTRGGDDDASEEALDLTRTGMVMGTPYYMSPEQARGERKLDARVDVYACGVIMYEALTGRRPFSASNYNALLMQIISVAPRSPRELRPALPESFEYVVRKAMARSRADRYQTAYDMQQALQLLRSQVPLAAPRPASDPRTSLPPPPSSAARPNVEPTERTPSSIEIPILFVPGDGPESRTAPPVSSPPVSSPDEWDDAQTQVQTDPPSELRRAAQAHAARLEADDAVPTLFASKKSLLTETDDSPTLAHDRK